MPAIQFWFSGAAFGAFLAIIAAIPTLGFTWYYTATQEQKKFSDAREAYRARPRPVFHIEAAGLINFDVGFRTGVTVKYRNSGSATAYDVVSGVSTAILPYPSTDQTNFPSATAEHESKGILVPGQEVFGSAQFDQPLTYNQISEVMDGGKFRLFVAGTLSFRDAAGVRCRQRFMFHLGGAELQRVASDKLAGRPLGGVPWLVANHFNDINPECE